MERREWRFSDESAAGRRQVMSHEEWMEQSSVTATSRQERATQKRIRAQRSALVEITSAHAAKREIGIKRILKPKDRASFNEIYVVTELMETDLSQIIKSN